MNGFLSITRIIKTITIICKHEIKSQFLKKISQLQKFTDMKSYYTNELKPGRGARDLAILFMII